MIVIQTSKKCRWIPHVHYESIGWFGGICFGFLFLELLFVSECRLRDYGKAYSDYVDQNREEVERQEREFGT